MQNQSVTLRNGNTGTVVYETQDVVDIKSE